MAKILVLDDDAGYCEEIRDSLLSENHVIFTANSGLQAIRLSMRYHPDLLISDWMLKEPLDGLSVVDSIRLFNEQLQVILISGFASNDLLRESEESNVFQLLEKPFGGEELRQLVDRALRAETPRVSKYPIGVLEISDRHRILRMNSYAKKTLALETRLNHELLLESLFEPWDFVESRARWIPVCSLSQRTNIVSMRSKEIENGRELIVFLTPEHFSYMSEPLVDNMLEISSQAASEESSTRYHLLVVDRFPQIRQVTAAILRQYRCLCHTAASYPEALKFFEKDSRISHVIVDLDTCSPSPTDFINSIRAMRPMTKIIGSCSAQDYSVDFHLVDALLRKPWSDEDLILALDSFEQPLGTSVSFDEV